MRNGPPGIQPIAGSVRDTVDWRSAGAAIYRLTACVELRHYEKRGRDWEWDLGPTLPQGPLEPAQAVALPCTDEDETRSVDRCCRGACARARRFPSRAWWIRLRDHVIHWTSGLSAGHAPRPTPATFRYVSLL